MRYKKHLVFCPAPRSHQPCLFFSSSHVCSFLLMHNTFSIPVPLPSCHLSKASLFISILFSPLLQIYPLIFFISFPSSANLLHIYFPFCHFSQILSVPSSHLFPLWELQQEWRRENVVKMGISKEWMKK